MAPCSGWSQDCPGGPESLVTPRWRAGGIALQDKHALNPEHPNARKPLFLSPRGPGTAMTGGQWFEPSDAQPHPPRPCPQSHHLSGGATRCFLSWTRCPSAWLFPITSKPLNLGMPLGLALYNRARFCRPHTASSSPSPMCTHTSACLNAYTAHMYARHTDRCTHPIL